MDTNIMLRNLISIGLITISLAAFSGCTTASYGLKPTPIENQQDTYKFKLFVGGFAGGETSDQAVQQDIETYKTNNGYKSYIITDKRYNLIPSYFEYTVHFSH